MSKKISPGKRAVDVAAGSISGVAVPLASAPTPAPTPAPAPAPSAVAAIFRSGVAARQAGVPVETLRVWERRYNVVSPQLSERGQRLYSAAEIQRLKLIKRLVDMGHPIGILASLPSDALAIMYATETTLLAAPPLNRQPVDHHSSEVRIVLVGPLLAARWVETISTLSGHLSLNVVGRCISAAEASEALRGVHADIAVIELSTLDDRSAETVATVKSICGAHQAIVMYRFAPSAVIRRLREEGHKVVRGPSDAAEIELLCRALLRAPDRFPPPVFSTDDNAAATELVPPHFDDRSLSALASASSTVDCECPRHLVELVVSLKSFEQYSAECISRSPKDAALHLDLQRTTSNARSMIEGALLRVAIAEGLIVPPPFVR